MKPACRRICDLLAQYADGTLAAEQRAEVQRHLEACPPCRVIAGKECGARQLLRACADRLRAEQVPPALRSRCQELSRRSIAAHIWSRRSVRLAAAAVLIIFTGSLLSVVTRQSDALLAAQLTADHVKCFGLFGPEEGRTLDAAQAQQMLRERFGMDVHVPPSSASGGLELVNARRCLYADGRIPHLMYPGERAGHLAVRAGRGVAAALGIHRIRPPHAYLVPWRPDIRADHTGRGGASCRRGPLRRRGGALARTIKVTSMNDEQLPGEHVDPISRSRPRRPIRR